jgi:signal transduction histidine kinase
MGYNSGVPGPAAAGETASSQGGKMSVYAGQRGDRNTTSYGSEPRVARAFLWLVSILTVSVTASLAFRQVGDSTSLIQLISWAAIVAAVDLIPVRVWGSVTVSMSFPVALAAGMLFSPAEAAIIAFAGSFDPRELTGGVSLAKSIFNRSQVAASVMAGSAAFHALDGSVMDWPKVLVPGLLALVIDAGVNFLLVASAVAIKDRASPRGVLRSMFGASPWHYLAGYLLLGLLALPLAAAFSIGGIWAVLLFLAPLGLTREMFRQTQQVQLATEQIRKKDVAILGVAGELVRERRDERLALAGELHDEVLPSLFKVHLMGEVLKQDLAAGKLLELDDDLPQLLVATDAAQRAIRNLLGDLRRSPIGAAGLIPTLRLLTDQLESAGAPPVALDIEEFESTPLAQLLAYQVIREALHNAAKHARATHLTVRLWRDDNLLRLSVVDDGVGFSWLGVDDSRHFGLQMMKERIEAAGGSMFVDSRLGSGTMVAASVPKDA